MLANQYIELAKAPISAEAFCGDDVRYSSEFEALELELAKADSLQATSGPDWNSIREGSEDLLQKQSKDLRAAVWLTWSLYQSESYQGLQAGLAALVYLCTHHWDELHPRKPRTRQAAFGWLAPRLEQAVESAASGPVCTDLATLQSVTTQLRELDACLSGHMLSDTAQLLPLCRRLDALAARNAQPDNVETPTEQQTASATVTPIRTQASGSPTEINDMRSAHTALRALQDQGRALCEWWLDQSATDPRAIRLSRTLLWLPINALPEHDAQQQTPLRGLPGDRVAAYAERLTRTQNQDQHHDLLREMEASAARSPFWLDGQRMVWECLGALGAQDAQDELRTQVQLLLVRLPGLEQLRFHDGVPFADDQTQAWLATPSSMDAKPVNTSLPSSPAGDNAPWVEALNTAVDVARKNSLKAGIAMLKHAMQTAGSERERFHWQFAQARLCHTAKHYELAAYQMEALYQQLHVAGLDRWEPELAISVLQVLAESYQRLPQKQVPAERRQQVYQRLCQLDLEAALDQTSGS